MVITHHKKIRWSHIVMEIINKKTNQPTKLDQIDQPFKNSKWPYYLAGAAVFFIILSFFINLITPKVDPVQKSSFVSTNKDGSTTQFSGFNFIGKVISVSTKMEIAEVISKDITEDYIKNQLIENLRLKPNKNYSFIWNGPTHALQKNRTENRYVLSLNSNKDKIINQKINKEEAIKTSLGFLSENFPNLKLSVINSEIIYANNQIEFEPSSPDEAQLMVIPFSYEINGFPIFNDNQSMPPFRITINNQYKILKMEYQLLFASFKTIKKVSTITIEEAIRNINNNKNKASIIKTGQKEIGPLSIDQLTSGKLGEVKIEYRIDPNQNIAYPFYKFSGKAINKEGIELTLTIITPAIDIR